MRSYDLIWVYELRTANVFGFWQWPGTVLDINDLPSGVYATLAQSEDSLSARLKAWVAMLIWRRRERLLGERFSVLAVCSEDDARRLSVSIPVHVVPNGVSVPTGPIQRSPAVPPRVGFVGLFDYEANSQGMAWFIERCWPDIASQVPGARLRLAGRGGETRFAGRRPDVDVLGWVPDVESEIATWSLMVVPLFIGGGTRVKIAEGLSRKCPIVSTSVGCYGYDLDLGMDLLRADAPGDFVKACVALLRDQARGAAMAERGYAKFLRNWTWDAIAPRVWAAAEDGLRASRALAAAAGLAGTRRR